MSEQAVPAHRLRDVAGLRRRGLVVLVVALGLIGAALWGAFLDGDRLRAPPMRPHLPDLSLVVQAPPQVQIHLAAALTALAIGIVMLAGAKGTALHRILGWSWVVAMGTAAISSFWIHIVNPGGLSFIHFLSGWTVIGLPAAIFAIRRRRVAVHARAMTAMFVGGLLLAGLLSFLPGRLMWDVWYA